MSVWSYPQEVHDFVRENCKKYRDAELAEKCNQLLGTEFTKSKMQSFRANHGYKSGFSKHLSREEHLKTQTRYPQGMYEFVRDHGYMVGSQEMADMIKAKFNFDISAKEVKAYRSRYHFSSHLTGWWRRGQAPFNKGKKIDEYVSPETVAKIRQTAFKKGNVPANTRPVGTIRKTQDGFLYYKRQAEGTQFERWIPLHRKVWEDHNGPIPDGYCVVFKDRNRENCNIDNLILMKRGELVTMIHKGYLSECPEATEARLTLVRIDNAKKKRRKGEANG